MRTLTFQNHGKLLLLIGFLVLTLYACSPGSGPGGPIDSSTKPSITAVNATPTTLVYDGSQSPALKSTITATVSGHNTTPTINGVPFNGSFVTDTLVATTQYDIVATNSHGTSTAKVTVSVVITPQVTLLSGNWKLIEAWRKTPIDPDWVQGTIHPDLADDVQQFMPYGKVRKFETLAMEGNPPFGPWHFAENGTVLVWGPNMTINTLTSSRLDVTFSDAGGTLYRRVYQKL